MSTFTFLDFLYLVLILCIIVLKIIKSETAVVWLAVPVNFGKTNYSHTPHFGSNEFRPHSYITENSLLKSELTYFSFQKSVIFAGFEKITPGETAGWETPIKVECKSGSHALAFHFSRTLFLVFYRLRENN